MSNDWNDQGTDAGQGANGNQRPGPEFDPGQTGPQDPYSQQGPYSQQDPWAQQDPNSQTSYNQQQSTPAWSQGPQSGVEGPGQQPYSAQQPYPGQQPQPGQQPYPGQPSWSQIPTQSVIPAKRSSVLGIIGLVVVVLATGAVMAAAWSFGAGLAALFLDLAQTGFSRDPEELMNDPRTIAYAETAAGTLGAAILSCVVGLVGWIISIVATATRRGRVFGIIGIVLGVLSLPMAYMVLLWVLNPVLSLMGS